MKAPVASAPIAIRPKFATSKGRRTILPAMLLDLSNAAIDVVDFEVAQPVRRLSIGNDSAHVEDAGGRLAPALAIQ
jgi:hypothetical protein